MKKLIYSHRILYIVLSLLFLVGCKDDEVIIEPPVIAGLMSEYNLAANETLELTPKVSNAEDATYSWWLDGKQVANTSTYTFKAPAVEGNHKLLVKINNGGGIAQKTISIAVGLFKRLSVNTYTLLPLEVPKSFSEKKNLKWEVTKAAGELYRLSYSKTAEPVFIAGQRGDYEIKLTAEGLTQKYLVNVRQEMTKQTPYIAKVFDYMPAPGQFVNKLPPYTKGDTHADMVAKVGSNLVGKDTYMITLGGWGGYVTFGFDHTVINVPGKCDFRIKGNAFGANANPRPNAPFGGSCEPGVIMVAYDKNKNGKPDDDEWYEIKGSGNFSVEQEPWHQIAVDKKGDVRTFRDYQMTYYRPKVETSEGTGEPNNPNSFVSIKNYIRWTDNKGQEGYKVKNVYHKQSYYPAWVKEDNITYKGVRLADNGIDESGGGSYYVLYAYAYGYVDNYPNADDRSAIDIGWAIDKDGNKANLPGIDFVKVYNGINKENGWLGEASTEVDGGEDLHMLGKSIESKVVIK